MPAAKKKPEDIQLYPAYRFAVTLTAGLKMIAKDLRFQSVGNLDLERKLEWQREQPFLVKDDSIKTITLKRGFLLPDAAANPLGKVTKLQLEHWRSRLLRIDLLISLLDAKGQPKSSWKVERAVLKRIDWGSLDANRNDIVLEEMQFEYRHLVPFAL